MATDVHTSDPAPRTRTAMRPVTAQRPKGRFAIDLVAVAICIVLAVIAQYTLPSIPGFDPFSWITWGHEIAHHVIGRPEPLILGGGPSWKPLPIVFTTIFGFTGRHALPLWTMFVRAVAFYSVYLAYVVGARLGANKRWSASGPVAGVLAAIALFTMNGQIEWMFRVTSEPLTVTAMLLWLDWHLRRRPLLGLAAGAALAMMRPEASFFVVLYALWYLWRLPGIWRRLVVVAEVVIVPLAWVLPPWIVTGDANQASSVARDFKGNQGQNLYVLVLHRADALLTWPVVAAAAIMVLISLWRRDWVPVGLAVLGLLWLVVFGVMTIKGYPGLTRFLLPPGAIACVLAGAGVAQLASLGSERLLCIGIAALCVAIAVPFSGGLITTYRQQHALAQTAARSYGALVTASHRAGGVARMFPCPSSAVAINHTMKTALAWALQVPLTRIDGLTFQTSSLRHPALTLTGTRNVVIGGAPVTLGYGLQRHQLFAVRMWHVSRVTRPGDAANACVGS